MSVLSDLYGGECIKLTYHAYLDVPVEIDSENAINTIESLIASVQMTEYPIYLLIDEYDNFANEVLMGTRQGKSIYESLVFEEGPLKTLFKTIKSSTSDSMFDRIFIVGVSPVVMSDMTSGYNIAENIYTDETYNALCGFTEEEIRTFLQHIAAEGDNAIEPDKVMQVMRTYYNRHLFAIAATDAIYNPTLALYFLKYFANKGRFPRKMLDTNLATDDAKLRYIANVPGGKTLLTDLNQNGHEVMIQELEDRFGVKDILSDSSKDRRFLASLLYYFGILTLNGETDIGELRLVVPNLVMQQLYVERLKKMLLPEPTERDAGIRAAKQVYTDGNMQPLVDFIEQHYFRIFHNPDYKWADELTIKTLFLSLLYNDTLYIMDSEPEVERRFPDLTMVIRPDMRRFAIFDVLIEFKYVKLGDLKMTGEQVRKTNVHALQQIPLMQQEMQAAQQQATDYGDALRRKYPDLQLKRFAVVAVGFERLWWKAVT